MVMGIQHDGLQMFGRSMDALLLQPYLEDIDILAVLTMMP